MLKRNILIRAAALAAALLLFFPLSHRSTALAADHSGNSYLTHVSLQVRDGKGNWTPYTEGNVIGFWEVFQLAYEWSIPDDIKLKANDTMHFTLPLPEELRFVTKSGSFPLTVMGDRVIGLAEFVCNGDTNEVKVAFTDGVEGLSSVHGQMIFHASWDTSVVTGEQQDTFSMDFNGLATVQVTSGQNFGIGRDETLMKWGNVLKKGDDYAINWTVRLNYKASRDRSWELANASYTDDLGPYQQYKDDSMQVIACEYDENGGIVPGTYVLLQEGQDYRLGWSNTFEGTPRFTVTLIGGYSPLKTSLRITYTCTITDGGAAERYSNYGCFRGDCFSKELNVSAYLFEGSGSASGMEHRPPASSETETEITQPTEGTSPSVNSTTAATPAPVATTVNTASSLSQTPGTTLTTAESSPGYPTEASPKTGGGVTLLPLTVIGVGAVAAILRPKRR